MDIIDITTTDYAARTASLLKLLPDIFNMKYNSILYIGAISYNFTYYNEIKNNYNVIDVIEINKNHCENIKNAKWINNIYNTSIENFNSTNKYDIVFWWHGPEHIKENDIQNVLLKLENNCNNYIVLGCPWGYSPIDSGHITTINENFFEKYGYNCVYSGKKNNCQLDLASGIVAVKKIY